mgnify:CR=1 FL=1
MALSQAQRETLIILLRSRDPSARAQGMELARTLSNDDLRATCVSVGNLSGIDFSPFAARGLSLWGLSLQGHTFRRSVLRGLSLAMADLTGTHFAAADPVSYTHLTLPTSG